MQVHEVGVKHREGELEECKGWIEALYCIDCRAKHLEVKRDLNFGLWCRKDISLWTT